MLSKVCSQTLELVTGLAPCATFPLVLDSSGPRCSGTKPSHMWSQHTSNYTSTRLSVAALRRLISSAACIFDIEKLDALAKVAKRQIEREENLRPHPRSRRGRALPGITSHNSLHSRHH